MSSRIAKMPIAIPAGTTVESSGGMILVKGKLGSEKLSINKHVNFEISNSIINVKAKTEDSVANMHAGTARALLNNLVHGVSQGFEIKLLLVGVGYKAAMQGTNLNLALGFSHPVVFTPPKGIAIEAPSQTEVLIKGTNKQLVGEVAAKIRAFRSPDAYKGKGIRYSTETIKLKETKKK